jgi:uroporphyrinogen-III synthase/uroporphyrinogen III methyltransferase/synthase
MPPLPLAGRRVLVTRAAHQAGKLSQGLRALGAEPVEVPVLEIQPPLDFAPLDRALRSLDSYDWLILTSANTVRALVERAASLGISPREGASPKVAAVGDATATAARNAGFAVALVPETYVAESLIDKLLRAAQEAPGQDLTIRKEASSTGGLVSGHDRGTHPVGGSRAVETQKSPGAFAPEGNLRGQRFLIARAAIARDVIPTALRAAGATVDVVDAYRNVMPASAPALLRESLQKGIAAAAFTSSSSVTHLADAACAAEIPFPLAGVTAISIGPITSQTLRELGWEPAAEASPSDVPGLIQAVARALADSL